MRLALAAVYLTLGNARWAGLYAVHARVAPRTLMLRIRIRIYVALQDHTQLHMNNQSCSTLLTRVRHPLHLSLPVLLYRYH